MPAACPFQLPNHTAIINHIAMKQAIVGFHQDEEGDWVARLACGHNQHVRHHPPWQNRPWVVNSQSRQRHLGDMLECVKCDVNAPRDWQTLPEHADAD